MDLSIIVPVYNTEKYIGKLLESLETQKVGEYEVEYIFVDNNCIDNSVDIIKASSIDAIVVKCEEQGCGLARNKGLEIAKGDYIWFIDSDDWLLTPNAIRSLLTAIKRKKTPLVKLAYDSNLYKQKHYAMVWQYILDRKAIGDLVFRKKEPSEDLVFMLKFFAQNGLTPEDYFKFPEIATPLYYYNYFREGSNMYKFYKEKSL